ncbi:MAG: hypothetical protein CL908_05795, partial [Deltaproteobacteria bacterium]|nr:hypothetical protein [Deltaproteobacteria bacterium]
DLGLSVLAVPIWQPGPDGRPRLAAVLALAAASARFDLLGEDTIAERLLPAAQAVAARLAGDGSLDGVGTRSAQTDRSRRHPSPRSVGEAGEDR